MNVSYKYAALFDWCWNQINYMIRQIAYKNPQFNMPLIWILSVSVLSDPFVPDVLNNISMLMKSRVRGYRPKAPTFYGFWWHYADVIMDTMAPQITSLTIVYITVYSGVDQRKHQSSVSLAFVRGIHQGPVNSPHKRPVTRKMFPFDDVIMNDSHLNLLFKETTWELLQIPAIW